MENERILIFGGTGSLGQALIQRYAASNELVLFSRDEAKHWTLKNNLSKNLNVKFMVGDVRDKARVEESLIQSMPTIVIIASALKQVDTCELSPYESVQTNLYGTKNIIDSVSTLSFKLKKLKTVLLVSTDKACAPTNVYGMCKAIAERIVTSESKYHKEIKFIGVRYGNVLESRGSIIPLFKHQVLYGDFLTVTHQEMTRFIMTLDQSIDLIQKAIKNGQSGEIWIPKIKSMLILDLAEIFSKKFNKPIKITGIRPGEKLHEDLISAPESIRTRKLVDNFVVNTPFSDPGLTNEIFTYSSNSDILKKETLSDYLKSMGIFEKNIKDFVGRSIEEIDTSR
jgi:UDP-N-acetylglucosamine 4,6-dehydratase